MENIKNQIDLFLKLVKIYSPVGQEKPIIDFLSHWLKKRQIKFNIDKRGNIFFGFYKNKSPMIFVAHLDTVRSPSGEIQPLVKNNFIISGKKMILGADNKASLSAMLTIIDWYLKEKPSSSVEFLFTCGEEDGSDFINFDFQKIKAKFGFVFDSISPIGTVITDSPEIINFEINFFGKKAHSANFQLGVNPINQGGIFLKKFPSIFDRKNQLIFNIGIVNAGYGVNVIPDRLTIKGEIRSLNKKKFFQKKQQLENYFSQINSQLIFSGYCPGYHHKKTNQLIKKVINSFKKLKITPQLKKSFAVSDANELNNQGIEIINLGDGVVNAHTDKEKININDLYQLTKIIKNFLLNF